MLLTRNSGRKGRTFIWTDQLKGSFSSGISLRFCSKIYLHSFFCLSSGALFIDE